MAEATKLPEQLVADILHLALCTDGRPDTSNTTAVALYKTSHLLRRIVEPELPQCLHFNRRLTAETPNIVSRSWEPKFVNRRLLESGKTLTVELTLQLPRILDVNGIRSVCGALAEALEPFLSLTELIVRGSAPVGKVVSGNDEFLKLQQELTKVVTHHARSYGRSDQQDSTCNCASYKYFRRGRSLEM